MEKFKMKKVSVTVVSGTFKGKIEEYALAWLNLTNHARIYPYAFLKCWNNDGNDMFVASTPERVEDVREFIEGIGVINIDTRNTIGIAPVHHYDEWPYDEDPVYLDVEDA